MTDERQAVLVFSNVATLDRARRGWPRAFEQLLECNDLPSWARLGFDVHVFTSPGFAATGGPLPFVHCQQGASFGDRLQNAVQTLSDLGYGRVVIVGSDCPDLQAGDIREAFQALRERRLVLGPDHRGGCYLIGLNVRDRHRLYGVRWQHNTDCQELVRRFGAENCLQLAVKLDLDSWDDVRLLARSASSWRELAVSLLRTCGPYPFAKLSKICSRATDERVGWQLPPPAVLSVPAL